MLDVLFFAGVIAVALSVGGFMVAVACWISWATEWIAWANEELGRLRDVAGGQADPSAAKGGPQA
jgi:hypothetical protein